MILRGKKERLSAKFLSTRKQKSGWYEREWQGRISRPYCYPFNFTRVTKKRFLLTISIQYQGHKWWEYGKILVSDYLPIQYQILQTDSMRTVRYTVKRIANEILGVTGLIWNEVPRVYVLIRDFTISGLWIECVADLAVPQLSLKQLFLPLKKQNKTCKFNLGLEIVIFL